MKPVRVNGIIHLFAILHVMVALLCRSNGVADEVWLTLLSMTMTVILCLYMYTNVELIVAIVIVINFVGYTLGVYGARLLALVFGPGIVSHAVSSFFTTEIIGWGTFSFLKLLKKKINNQEIKIYPPLQPTQKTNIEISHKHVLRLIGGLLIIILFRILLTYIFKSDNPTEKNLLQILNILLENYWLLIIMLCVVIVFIRHLRLRCTDIHSGIRITLTFLVAIIISSAVALAAGTDIFHHIDNLSSRELFQLFIVSLTFFLVFYSVVYLLDYVFATRAEIYRERQRTAHAKFQYEKLRQQVSPHFLFNSLNALEYLIDGGEKERASSFVYKLAGMYRYMLDNSSTTVSLDDEMTFVGLYVGLMEERFAEGFEVISDIPDQARQLRVIPCSIQMLLENAFKHNMVGKNTKLEIRIYVSNGYLTVSNNILPKVSVVQSTRVGLNYLNTQYLNICNREIIVTKEKNLFKVSLPLISFEK